VSVQVFNPSSLITSIKDGTGATCSSVVLAGPPGTGKSTFLGSMAEVIEPKRLLVIATLPRELDSWKYQEHNPQRLLLEDSGWAPAQKLYNATAYNQFLETLDWLREEDDQFDGVVVDNGTELAEQAWHLALAPNRVGSPSELDGQSRWLPYETLDSLMDQGIKGLVALTKIARRPKHVAIAWHVQPPKDDTVDNQTKVKKESADNAGRGVEYEGDVLPMVRGRYRRRVAGQFSAVLYTDIKMEVTDKGLRPRYRLQVRPNQDRHTKLPGPLPPVAYIDNNFKDFLALLRGEVPANAYIPEASAAPAAVSPLKSRISRKSQ